MIGVGLRGQPQPDLAARSYMSKASSPSLILFIFIPFHISWPKMAHRALSPREVQRHELAEELTRVKRRLTSAACNSEYMYPLLFCR